jgi:hypothetical protein
MKKIILIFVLLTFIPFVSYGGYNEYFPDESKKITKIKTILLVCDRSISPVKADYSENECDDSCLDGYINKSSIKFVTRNNLKDILNEQTISQSGLTNEKVAELGKLYSASHILFYKQVGPYGDIRCQYIFKLVNTSTSEIEYSAAGIFEYTLDYKKKNKDQVLGYSPLSWFFHILNLNSATRPEEKPPWEE